MNAPFRKFIDKDRSLGLVHKFVPVSTIGDRQVRAIISDSLPDRANDEMNPQGAVFSNPLIALWNHDSNSPVGNSVVSVKGNQLVALTTFAPPGVSAIADEVCGLVKSGIVSGYSIGFQPLEFEYLGNGGVRYTKFEILEAGPVSVPCNPRAVVTEKSLKGTTAMYAAPMTHEYESPTAVLGGLLRFCATGPQTVDKYERIEAVTKSFGCAHPVTRLVTKALSLAPGSGGAFIIPPEMQSEIIQRLLPKSVCRKAGAQSIESPKGNLTLPTVTSGTSSYWLPMPGILQIAQGAFGQIVSHARKLAVLVPVSNDLLRYGVESTDEQIGELLLGETGAAEDQAFLRADGTSNQPVGLKGFITRTNAIVTSNATFTAVTVLAELKACLQLLLSANVGMIRGAWVFHPTIELFLRTLQNEQGIFPFAHEMTRGTLLGQKFYSTTQIPNNLGSGGDATEIYCCDFSELLLFNGPEAEIITSGSASWFDVDSSNLVSGYQDDMSLIRCILGRDSQLKHVVAASMIQGVVWN
jgi:HK97 family phage major capsid protein